MKTVKSILIILGISLVIFVSCEKDDTESAEGASFQIEFETITSDFDLKSNETGTLEFSSGQIILESVEFEASSDNDTLEAEFEIESYITIDFATGETNPDISAIKIAPGNYTEIEIELELWDQSEQPSIVLNGQWTDTHGESHPVRFEFDSGQDFSLEIEGNFTIDQETTMIAQITFDPGVWFSGVDQGMFSSATTNDEGVIVISSGENTDIYDIVEDMIDLVSEVEISINNLNL